MSQVRIQNKSLLVKYQTLRDKLNQELTYRDQEMMPFKICYETIFIDIYANFNTLLGTNSPSWQSV